MCGRTYCSLNREAMTRAAAYRTTGLDGTHGPYQQCQWLDGNKQSTVYSTGYAPHYNITRDNWLPVLVNRRSVDKQCEDSDERVLVDMRWGYVPAWRGPDGQNSGGNLNPINCRIESLTEKPMFRPALNNKRRCVVLVDGFFEWKNNGKDGSKQLYFLYLTQKNVDFKTENTDWIKQQENRKYKEEDNEWKGQRLLPLAAIYNRSTESLFTVAIITVPIHPRLEWLHTRMPAVLNTDESVRDWLDIDNVNNEKAIKLLVPFGGLEYHPVSSQVSNTRNNSADNILPNKVVNKQRTIDTWFKSPKVAMKKKEQIDDSDGQQIESKRFKE